MRPSFKKLSKSAFLYSLGLTITTLIIFKIFYPYSFQSILTSFISVPICLECGSYLNLNIPQIITGLIILIGYNSFWYWSFLLKKKSQNFRIIALSFWAIVMIVGILVKSQYGCPGMEQQVQFLKVDQATGKAEVYQKTAGQTYSCELSGNLVEDAAICQQTFSPGFTTKATLANLAQDLCSKDQLKSNGRDFIIQLQKSGRSVDCQYSCEATKDR